MWSTFTNKVRKAFTDAADQYDILTSLHKEIGRELVKKVVRLDALRILDVGCGTGYVANKAKFFFPESAITGVDISEGMLAKAAQAHEGVGLHWVQGDVQALPFKDGSFNLILSNLAYQWAGDLKLAFQEAHRTLVPSGVMNSTLFGARTCGELFASLQAVDPALKLRALPEVGQMGAILRQAGFVNIKTDYELIKVEFKDVVDLIGWLKNIGANISSTDRMFLGKNRLIQAQDHYRTHYPYGQGICASFEIIWVYAEK